MHEFIFAVILFNVVELGVLHLLPDSRLRPAIDVLIIVSVLAGIGCLAWGGLGG